ncbi:MAG TPA: hypothetical protein VF190_15705 [Rhodothermales bacterium]
MPRRPATTPDETPRPTTKSVYADFTVWTSKTKPDWHPVKKMRYVFFRMISGVTITDALKEIRWSPSEFWHLIDQKQNDPFHREYLRAKTLQGRAIGDSVLAIAEGRDPTTKKSLRKLKKLIDRGLRRAGKAKTRLAAKAVVESLLAQLSEHDAKIVARNKVQIDAAKWLSARVNPLEYSDKASLSLVGTPDGSGAPTAIQIQFVAPDGSVVVPFGSPEPSPAEDES